MPSSKRGAKARESGIRERILAAAVAALQEDGVRGLSQVQVARRAKVRQSHLTYYFAKRQDLIEAVATRFLDGIADAFDEVASASTATGDAAPLLERLASVIVDQRHMRMFTAIIVEADDDPEVRAILVRVTRRLQSMVAVALGGPDAAERAELVTASLWGLGLYEFVLRPKRPGARVAAYIASVPTRRGRSATGR
jgi:AcrR family transcriptional regulator